MGEAVMQNAKPGRASIAVLLLLASALLASPAAAQNGARLNPPHTPPDKAPPADRTIRVDVDLVLVNATVTDPYNRLVTGLERENFRIFEDNQEQEVTHFSSEDVPISIGLVFDSSGSMSNKVDKSRLAAIQFFKTANPQDEFFLVTFNDRAQLVSRFTNSVEELQNRLM
jgi:Ca-activated chloride channel family protein